jgi:hypothetical protein
MMNEIDELIINLNILSTLTPNKKLIVRGQLLNIEKYDSNKMNITQSISRWVNGESRNISLTKIDKIITSSGKIINCVQQQPINNDIQTDTNKLFKYIKKSKDGINNLKKTYESCPQSVARIEVLIFKIDCICELYTKNNI